MFDIIGDSHGYADELEALLKKLGYSRNNGAYSHPERKALFVGDYIDRGPKIKEVLGIIRPMVECDNAIALMGNHEYNALCFHFQDSEGGYLRWHTPKNNKQHEQTLNQFKSDPEKYLGYLGWFMTLPLYFETDTFRVVHACWDNNNIQFLRRTLENDRLTDALIYESVKKGTPFYEAINQTLKGKEIKIPGGLTYQDKDGNTRDEIRIKWWEDPEKMTYKTMSVQPVEELSEQIIDISSLNSKDFYDESQKIVFFGHYWLTGDPSPYKSNVCCLDYSVANEGKLVAYRIDEEPAIEMDKYLQIMNMQPGQK